MNIRRRFKRKSGVRDSTLIIIATEGQQTEPQYFNGLQDYCRNPKVHVEVVERSQTASSPAHVIRELDKFKKTYSLTVNDNLCMAIDFDRWGPRKLSEIATLCNQKSYMFVVSNPRFEIWLLLHFLSLSTYANLDALSKNDNIEKEIKKYLGSYNKSNIDIEKFLPHTKDAISRAREIDNNPSDRWPQSLGTRIYKLVELILPIE